MSKRNPDDGSRSKRGGRKGGPLPAAMAHELRMRATAMMAEGMRDSDIARELEVHQTTVMRWRREPEVQAEIEAIGAGLIEAARAMMRRGVSSSAALLVTVVESEACDPSVRVTAAKALLDRAATYLDGDKGTPQVRVVIEGASVDDATERLRALRERGEDGTT